MLQARLLERIANLEKDDEQPLQAPAASQINSIISHLSRLLNTRQGSVTIAPDFGVPDLTNIPDDNILEIRQRIERIIEKVVQKYEPRLCNVRMSMQHSEKEEFTLRFRLEANLAEQEDVPVIFETRVSTEGQVTISS